MNVWLLLITIFFLTVKGNLPAHDFEDYNRESIEVKSLLVQQKISSIPLKDRIQIERFFRRLIIFDDFGYTLFGDKPVSIYGYFLETPLLNVLLGKKFDTFDHLLSVWKKYSALFPSDRFLFIDEPQKTFKMREFVVINKLAFKHIVNKNISLFRSVLEEEITPEKLLNYLEQPGADLKTILHHHEGLLGIVLGYGVHNSLLYHRRDEILSFKEQKTQVPFELFSLEPSPNFLTLDEELQYLWDHLKLCGEYRYSFIPISSVCFVGDHSHSETKELLKKYQRIRKKLSLIYSKKDFLNTTLTQIMDEKAKKSKMD